MSGRPFFPSRSSSGSGTPPASGSTSRNPVLTVLEAALGSAAHRAPSVTGVVGGFLVWDGLDHIRDAFVRNPEDNEDNLELKNVVIGVAEVALGLISVGAILSSSPQHKLTGLTCAGGAAALGYALSNWRGAGVAPEI